VTQHCRVGLHASDLQIFTILHTLTKSVTRSHISTLSPAVPPCNDQVLQRHPCQLYCYRIPPYRAQQTRTSTTDTVLPHPRLVHKPPRGPATCPPMRLPPPHLQHQNYSLPTHCRTHLLSTHLSGPFLLPRKGKTLLSFVTQPSAWNTFALSAAEPFTLELQHGCTCNRCVTALNSICRHAVVVTTMQHMNRRWPNTMSIQ
jgi:hypothetical protein